MNESRTLSHLCTPGCWTQCHTWMSHVIYEWIKHIDIHVTYEWIRLIDDTWRIWMSHTHGWVMWHINESCHTWMSRITSGWVASRINDSDTWIIHVGCNRVMLIITPCTPGCCTPCHTWLSHVTYEWTRHMDESSHVWMSYTHEWVMSHMDELDSCMSQVTHKWVMSYMNESCHIWMSHVTYKWVMSHMNESCHI